LKAQGFPFDKPAATPCVHLDAPHRCSIHATRRNHGFVACESFDCFGAGQWVTQRLFGGAKWTDSPDIARRMFAAYRAWVPRFEAAALIEAALPYVREDARASLAALMTELTSCDIADRFSPNDARRLHREMLGIIRSALRSNDASA
jgi:hypothetical protein